MVVGLSQRLNATRQISHTSQVAQKHYLEVTEEHFEQAMTARAANRAGNSVKTCHHDDATETSTAHEEESSAANALQNSVETGCEALQGSVQSIDVKPLPATKNSFLQVYAESCQMDDIGLEPTTSTMSTWRSNQLS